MTLLSEDQRRKIEKYLWSWKDKGKDQSPMPDYVCIWIARFQRAIQRLHFWLGPMALFMIQPKMQNVRINVFLDFTAQFTFLKIILL